MPAVPAVCSNCGLIFHSRISLKNVVGVELAGNTETCPRCQSQAEVVSGVYEGFGETLNVVLTKDGSTTRLDALLHALQIAQQQKASSEQVRTVIIQHAPQLQKLADAVPKTPLGLNDYIKTVCLILTTLLAFLAYMESRKQRPTPEEIERKIEQAISKAMSSPAKQVGTPSKQKRAKAKKARHK